MCFFITFYITIVVVIEGFDGAVSNFSSNLRLLKYFNMENIPTSLPSLIFAFGCHPNVLDVYRVKINFSLMKGANY